MNKAINYQMLEWVKSQLSPSVHIVDAVVKGKWLSCTVGTKEIRMTSYNGQDRLAATITFSVIN